MHDDEWKERQNQERQQSLQLETESHSEISALHSIRGRIFLEVSGMRVVKVHINMSVSLISTHLESFHLGRTVCSSDNIDSAPTSAPLTRFPWQLLSARV